MSAVPAMGTAPRLRRPQMPPLIALVSPAILAILIVADLIAQPALLELDQIGLEVQTALPLVFLCFAQTLVVLLGALDLSVGGMMVVANTLTASWLGGLAGSHSWLLVVIVLIGAAMGALNGLIVTRLGLAPFIATLATWSIFNGVALLILSTDGGEVPLKLTMDLTGQLAGIPVPLLVLVGLLAFWWYLKRTSFGYRIYAVGSDEQRAALNGIDIKAVKIAAFALGGVMCALGGIFLAATTSTGLPTAGDPYILQTFAAVVIGGAALRGGSGGFGPTVMGAFSLVLIADLVTSQQLPAWVSVLASALLLLAMVTVRATIERRSRRLR